MSDPTPTRTIWQLLDAHWVDADPDIDVLAVSLRGNGKIYSVVCSGPKGMTSSEIIGAVRVAAAGLLRAVGGDMSVVGCGTFDEASDAFDTGTQRAN